MRIVCPFCGIEREIEHSSSPCDIECVCGRRFPLGNECILEEYSEIDCALPEKIGKYPVLELIGFGGMGKIYKAMHPELMIPVAIKALKKEFSGDERSRDRFIRSARICARISHPNVVRVYDCGYDGDELYLVMEYIDGGSAQDLLEERGHLTPEETAYIAAGVCTGLMEAEARNIVHRDIKPENIMFDIEGTVKLLDLGLAKISGDKRLDGARFAATILNTSLGTAEYMSPEQALDAASCDGRSDIYSLGATMYHLLTGNYPFGSGDAGELKRKHALEALPPPSSLVEKIPPAMDEIVLKCMAKNRSQRYQSASMLLADLQAFLAGEKVLPSFRAEKRFFRFRQWENAFNAPFFRRWPNWERAAGENSFLSPFRLLLLFLVVGAMAVFSAYLSTKGAPRIPVTGVTGK